MNLQALMQRAAAAVDAADLQGAEPLLQQVVTLNPRDAEAWHMLAAIAIRSGRGAEAIESAKRAHQLERRNPLYLNTLGIAHSEAGEVEEAVRWFKRALKERPSHAESHYNLGKAQRKLEQWSEAERSYLRARQLDPASGEVANNLAALYCRRGRYDEAMPLLVEARARMPGDEASATNTALAMLAIAGPEAAIEQLSSFVAQFPHAAGARATLGRRLLARGRFAQGWQEYAWRHAPRVTAPVLESGQRVLLLPDQGIGDHLFFLRFAARLRQCAAHVAFACPPKIRPLLEGSDVVDELCDAGCSEGKFDLALPIGDLPQLLQETGTPPPLPLNRGPVDRWLERLAALGPAPYLGLTWRGGGKRAVDREFGADGEVPLFKEVGVDLLASAIRGWPGTVLVLQRFPSSREIETLSKILERPVHDLSALNEQLPDMAAVLSLIDEYVGVSNTNMHIRAGVGKSARVLVPFPAEFRWMDEGSSSPWFPGFVTYRQPPSRDWAAALVAVRNGLSI
jgi:Flp pilus assembly protein TadD